MADRNQNYSWDLGSETLPTWFWTTSPSCNHFGHHGAKERILETKSAAKMKKKKGWKFWPWIPLKNLNSCNISLTLYLLIIYSAMHNISSSDLPPITRRRCESEGKKKTRPRPVSAMIYPPGRGRSDTEPTSPNPLVRTISSSVSTRNLSEFESPKNKTPSVLNRLRSRRKSKEGSCVFYRWARKQALIISASAREFLY